MSKKERKKRSVAKGFNRSWELLRRKGVREYIEKPPHDGGLAAH
jgi:hypothetical protein